MNKLSDLKKKLKKKMPSFKRKDNHKKIRLGDSWRKPKGLQNKMRLQVNGHRAIVKNGYRTPRLLRGMSNKGLNICRISCMKDIKALDPKKDAIVVSSKLSIKKLLTLLPKLAEEKFSVLNFNDVSKKIDEIKKKQENAKKEKEKTLADRKKKKEALAKEKKDSKNKEADNKKQEEDKTETKKELTEEQKAEREKKKKEILDKIKKEKKDNEKILTKKQ